MTEEVKKLDLTQKQNVTYCIPLWLRDEQIKQAIARFPDRVQPQERRPEPIAVVGYGPSLQDTWEKLKDFKYIISTSGAHKFLLERDIIPTYHAEVDPREHKVPLLGPPHPAVQYLIASTCHPKYFEHLANFVVKIWHVFDATEDGLRMLPPGEWAVTGGCDVGLRAISLAAFLGFRDLHIFGLDGCAKGPDTTRHAGEHPYGKQKLATVEHKGRTFWTTPAMLEAARQTFHELDQMPKVKVTFYGDGLTQAMARDYTCKTDDNALFANIIGYVKPILITTEYVQLNRQLHEQNLSYGVGGGKHAEVVKKLFASGSYASVLDYGCGKGYLAKALPFPIWEYDPAVVGKEASPRAADLVVCTDVLEHIEPGKLPVVLADLQRCVLKLGYFIINTGPAQKTLPDGRNTHLIQKNKEWWKARLKDYFLVVKIFEQKANSLVVMVAPQQKPGVNKTKTKMKTMKVD